MVSDSRPGTCDMADDAIFRLALKEVTLRTFDEAAAKLDEIIDRRFTELIEMIKSLAKAPSPAAMEASVTETSLELQSEEAAVTDALQTRKPPSNSMSNSMPKVIISEFENDAGFGKFEVLTAEVCVESIKTELDFEYELFSEVADKVGSIDLKNKASLTDIEKCFSRVCENKLAGFGRCFIIPPLKPPDIVINTDESPPKKPPYVASSHTQVSGDTDNELKPLICLKSVKDFCIYSARHNVTGFGAFNPTLGTIIPVMGGFAVRTIDGSVAAAASLVATAAGPSDTKMARMIEGVDEFEFNNKVSSTALAECIPIVCENDREIKLTRFEACFNLRPKKPPDDTKIVSTVFAAADMLPYNLLMKFFVKKPTGMIGGVGDRLSTASIVRSLLPGLDCEFVVNLVLEDLPQKDPWHAHILGILCIWVGGSSTKGPGGIVSKILTEPIGGNHTPSRSPVGILDSKIVFEEWLILEYTRKLAWAESFFIQFLRPFPKDKVGWSLKVTFPALFMRFATASMSIYQFLIIVGQHDKYWQNDQWALLYKYIEKYWQDDRLELGESMILCCTLCTHADMVPFIATLVDNSDLIVSTSHDKSLILWHLTNTDTDKNFGISLLSGHSYFAQDVVLSSNGQFSLYGSWYRNLRLWVWDASVSARNFVSHTKDVFYVAFYIDNRRIVSASHDMINFWNALGEWKHTEPEGDDHSNWVSCVQLGLNTQLPTTVPSWNVNLWNFSKCKLRATLVEHSCVCFMGQDCCFFRTNVPQLTDLIGRAGTASMEVLNALGSSMSNLKGVRWFVSGAASRGNAVSVLAFEVANMIVKGANLMQSFSDVNIKHMKKDILRSEGVQPLVSVDISYLLSIVASDKRKELEVLTEEVIRFGDLCKDPQWHHRGRFFIHLDSDHIQKLQRGYATMFMNVSAKGTTRLFGEGCIWGLQFSILVWKYSFGVSKSGIDICFVLQGADKNEPDILLRLAEIVESDRLQNVQALLRARVPIVKLMDPKTDIYCDICINNVLAVVNTKFLRDHAQIDVRLQQLAFIEMHWAKSRRVNETYQGTLSSYAYVPMRIHFWQQHPAIPPCLQPEEQRFLIWLIHMVLVHVLELFVSLLESLTWKTTRTLRTRFFGKGGFVTGFLYHVPGTDDVRQKTVTE